MNAESPVFVDTDAKSCAAVTPEKLENLGAGCFVRVTRPEGCFWAEITGETGENQFIGTVHRELATEACCPPQDSVNEVRFGRDEITLLGCDNHCWC